jgi:hypothetical protein
VDALGKRDADRAKAILDGLAAEENPAVKPLRAQLQRLLDEKKRAEERTDLIKKGEKAATDRDFAKARGYFADARAIADDEQIRAKLAWLEEKERRAQAEALEKEGDAALEKDPAAAVEKYKRAAEQAPGEAIETKLARARYRAALARADAAGGAPGKEREAALREALRAIGARDEFGEERKTAEERLEKACEEHAKALTSEQKRAYLEELTTEARGLDKDLDFRAALVCYRSAIAFAEGDEVAKRQAEAEAAAKNAEEQGKFEFAMEVSRATREDPTASPRDKKYAAENLQKYVDEFDGTDEAGRPKGHFVDKAKEEQKRWSGG